MNSVPPNHDASDIRIRVAVQKDVGRLVDLLSQMHDGTRSHPTRELEATWREILTDPHRFLLVAETQDVLVGTLDLVIVPNLTHDGQPWAMIENIVVDARLRRKGIGRRLMEEAVERARATRCYKIQLVSNERRASAHRLYEVLKFDAPVRGFRRYL